jgi:hypothetical protein
MFMARAKLFTGFLLFLVGCALAIFLFAMLLDDSTVYPETLKIWFGASSLFSLLSGLLILGKSNL